MVITKKNSRVKKILIPGKFYEMRKEENPTRYRMDPTTGRMTGRYSRVPDQYSDNVMYLAMKYNIDVTGDKKPDFLKGQIIGRLPRVIQTKPDKVIVKLKLKPWQRLKPRAKPTLAETKGAYRVYKK